MIAPLALAALSAIPAPRVTHRGTTLVVTQQEDAAALAGTMLFVRAGFDREAFAQSGLAELTAQTVLETPSAGGLPLREAIADAGGSIEEHTDAGDVRFYVEGFPAGEDALLDLFAAALRAPDFSAATVARARADVAAENADPGGLGTGLEMLDGGSAAGNAVSRAQIVPEDVRTFYRANYRIGGAVVSTVGAAVAGADYARIADALAPGVPAPPRKPLPALRGASHEFVAYRDIQVPWLVARYRAPSYGDADFGAMLVLASFVDRTLRAIGQVPQLISSTSVDDAVGSIYAFDGKSPNLTVYLYGGLPDPSRAFASSLSLLKDPKALPIAAGLDDLKAEARGRFARDAGSLQDRAWLAGVFARTGSSDYLNRTFAAIDAASAADVERVARRYLGDPTIAMVLPRQQEN